MYEITGESADTLVMERGTGNKEPDQRGGEIIGKNTPATATRSTLI